MGFHIGYESVAEHDQLSWMFCLYLSKQLFVARLFGVTLTIERD